MQPHLMFLAALACALVGPALAGNGFEVEYSGECVQAIGPISVGTPVDVRPCDGSAAQDFAEADGLSTNSVYIRHQPSPGLCVGQTSPGGNPVLEECGLVGSAPGAFLNRRGDGVRVGYEETTDVGTSNGYGVTNYPGTGRCLDLATGGPGNDLSWKSPCALVWDQTFGPFTPLVVENVYQQSQGQNLCLARKTAGPALVSDEVVLLPCLAGDPRQQWIWERKTKQLHPFGFPNMCVREGMPFTLLETCIDTYSSMQFNLDERALPAGATFATVLDSNNNRRLYIDPASFSGPGTRVRQGAENSFSNTHGRWRRWECRNVAGHFYNVNNGCQSCANARLDRDSGCSACVNDDIDIAATCNSCVNPNRSLSSLCQDCVSPNYADSTCSTCLPGYSPYTSCFSCFFGLDPAESCTQCFPGYSLSSSCSLCDGPNQNVCDEDGKYFVGGNVDTSGGVSTVDACRILCNNAPGCKWFSFVELSGGTHECRWSSETARPELSDATSDSNIISAVFAPDKCTEGPGFAPHRSCTMCRNDFWEQSTNCTSCVGLRTQESNCLACPNTEFDVDDDCNTCAVKAFSTTSDCDGTCKNENYLRHSGDGCEYCRDGFLEPADPADEGCLTCRPNWAAPLCETCEGSMDINLDCSEPLTDCANDDVEIWNVTERLSTRTNATELNLTVEEERCMLDVGPKEVYRYLSCSTGSLTELSRAFQCSADWVRTAEAADYAAFNRKDSFLLDGLIESARGFANDDSLPWMARAKAEQLAGTWQIVRARGSAPDFIMRYHPDLKTPNSTLHSRFAAPPLLMPIGTTRRLTDADGLEELFAAAQASYRAMLAPQTLLKKCTAWLQGFGKCECGQEYDSSSTLCIEVDDDDLANLWAVHMSCALADDIIGTYLGAEMLQRTAACVEREVWKEQDVGTYAGLLQLARAAATVSKPLAVDIGTSPIVQQSAIFEGIKQDAGVALSRLAKSSGVMAAANAVAVARISSVDRADDLEDAVDGEFEALAAQLTVLAGIDGVRSYMNTLANDISTQMQMHFSDVQNSLEGLAELILGTTATAMAANQANFLAMTQGELSKLEGRIITAQQALVQERQSVRNKRVAIVGVKQDLDAMLARLPPIGEQIGDKAEEYYECRKKDELARLARARAVAIFDVVVNSIALVAEAGALVATFGASQGVTSLARTVGRQVGEAALDTIKDEVKGQLQEEVEAFTDGALGVVGIDAESLRSQAIGSAGALLGADEEGGPSSTVIGTILDGGDPGDVAEEVLDTVKAVGEAVLESAVPFYGSIKGIMEASKVLSDYNGAKDEVKAEFRESMRKSTEALEKLGELAAELGDFASGMMLELGQLLKLNIPARSVIESTSTATWRSMKERIISFAKSTEIYRDFEADARRRALLVDEDPEDAAAARRTLESLGRFDAIAVDVDDFDEADQQVQQEEQSGVRGLLEARASMSDASSMEMRRSLDSKKGCNTGPFARAGLEAFAAYFEELNNVEFFGTALHEELITLLGSTRRIIVLKTELTELNKTKLVYQAAEAELMEPQGGALETHGSAMREVLQAAFQRTVPAITSFQPGTFARVTQVQENFLWDVCNAARYRYLAVPPTCDFRVGDVVANQLLPTEPFTDTFGQYVSDIKADLRNMRVQARPTPEWVRLRIASSAEIRAAVQPRSLDGDAVYSFRFAEAAAEMADLTTCGYNHEIVAYAMTLEAPAHPLELHPAALEEDEYSYALSINKTAPAIKLDRYGNRHAFYVDIGPSDAGVRRARIVAADNEDCGFINNDVESVVIRRDRHRVCVVTPDDDEFGISPVSPWGTNFSLQLMDLAPLVADEDLELDLVMYVRLRGDGMDPGECEAAQFVERGTDTAGADSGGADVGVIIGASLAAVVIAGAGAFVAKRVRDNRRKEVPWSKVLYANPASQPLPEL